MDRCKGVYSKNMNIQKHKNEQGGYSEAWVGFVYIVYSMVGLTLGSYLGELTTAVLMTVVPIFIYTFYLGIEEERQKEQIAKPLEAPTVPALEETDEVIEADSIPGSYQLT